MSRFIARGCYAPKTSPMKHLILKTAPALLLIIALAACTPAPPGTESWVQAQRQFEKGDYADTLEHLTDLLSRESDYGQRASAWKVMILGAMTRAAMEWEESCAEGVYFVPQWESKNYRICIGQYRRRTKTRVLALLDAVTELEQTAESSKTIALGFPLPHASVDASPILRRIKVGNMAGEDVLEAAAARTLDRHFILQTMDAVGADDPADAKSRFESLPVTVEKARFLLGLAQTLQQAADAFEPGRLDDAARRKMVLKRTRECLQPALQGENEAVKAAARALARKARG